jgi:hypothetical protein
LTPGDDADLSVQVSITDVRNQDDLTDYTGELGLRIARQITDRDYAPLDSGTTAGDALFVPVSCMPTSGSAGSTCATSTTANTIQPGLVKSGKRAIWDLGAIEVLDGGSNGVAGAPDATVFEQQGFFAP